MRNAQSSSFAWIEPSARPFGSQQQGGSYDTNIKDYSCYWVELGLRLRLAVSTSPRATNGATVIPGFPWCLVVEISHFYLREMTS